MAFRSFVNSCCFCLVGEFCTFYLYFAGLMRTELFLFILLFEGCFWLFLQDTYSF